MNTIKLIESTLAIIGIACLIDKDLWIDEKQRNKMIGRIIGSIIGALIIVMTI